VPISAVVLDAAGSSTGTVQVLANNTLSTVPVTILGVGATQVAIGKGVNAGDMVVVADIQAALPTSLDNVNRALNGGGTMRTTGGSNGGAGQRPGG